MYLVLKKLNRCVNTIRTITLPPPPQKKNGKKKILNHSTAKEKCAFNKPTKHLMNLSPLRYVASSWSVPHPYLLTPLSANRSVLDASFNYGHLHSTTTSRVRLREIGSTPSFSLSFSSSTYRHACERECNDIIYKCLAIYMCFNVL